MKFPKPMPTALLFALAAAFAAPVAADDNAPAATYLCCNMRTDGGWISDSNYMESGKTMIPFGTPVSFRSYGRYRVNVTIGGKRQSIGNDYSRDLGDEAFAKRYLVSEDPRPKVAAAPAKIRQAIESARVTEGMTREQVLISLGYPISSETPHLDSPVWRYWLWSFSPFLVHFGKDGRVAKVEADLDTRSKVYLD